MPKDEKRNPLDDLDKEKIENFIKFIGEAAIWYVVNNNISVEPVKMFEAVADMVIQLMVGDGVDVEIEGEIKVSERDKPDRAITSPDNMKIMKG